MHVSEIKSGMTLRCIGDYADCIHKGRNYLVFSLSSEPEGKFITCDAGPHELVSSATDEGELPEFEPLSPAELVP